MSGSIASFHIDGIADAVHYHDRLEQQIATLQLQFAQLRGEWDEFIEAQLDQPEHNETET